MTMTRQEIFDVVWNGLKSQGFRQSLVDPNKFEIWASDPMICAYRGEDGCKCAFGHLIPDDLYDSKIENSTVFSFAGGPSSIVSKSLAKWFSDSFADEDVSFLKSLQDIHDEKNNTPAKMERDYRKFANYLNLTIPE